MTNLSAVDFTGKKTNARYNGHYWAEVTYDYITGWVAATFLQYELPSTRAPMVYVGEHNVATVGNHANVIIYADPNSQLVKDNPDLFENSTNMDGVAWSYGTLGAAERDGNMSGDLIAKNNRPKDVGVVTGTSPDARMTSVTADYEQAMTLISCDIHFRAYNNGTLTYQFRMTGITDKYNSNSFANGLLRAAGITVSNPPGYFPGWDNPIPATNYGK